MTNKFLEITRRDGVVTLTMNLPRERNALPGPEACTEFEDACRDATLDTSVTAVILTGAGTAFSAGGNLKQMRDRNGMVPGKNAAETRHSYRNNVQKIARSVYQLEVPTIAAINGPAIGAGMDFAMMCDIRLSSEKAIYAESFVKLGIIPGGPGSWILPRLVGASKAAELSFTGETFDAAEALRLGLVSQVVAHDDLMQVANDLADRISQNPVHAVRMTKRLLRVGEHSQMETMMELSAAYQAIVHETDDHREAVAAMLEKRKPNYTGN
ncbi:enoyl-CoA hydratase [Rhodobacterales bacterium 52_120_T64]|nr:enoyl-CoA hydratase [Rhodobacterales bacterium 52_120_T64]